MAQQRPKRHPGDLLLHGNGELRARMPCMLVIGNMNQSRSDISDGIQSLGVLMHARIVSMYLLRIQIGISSDHVARANTLAWYLLIALVAVAERSRCMHTVQTGAASPFVAAYRKQQVL